MDIKDVAGTLMIVETEWFSFSFSSSFQLHHTETALMPTLAVLLGFQVLALPLLCCAVLSSALLNSDSRDASRISKRWQHEFMLLLNILISEILFKSSIGFGVNVHAAHFSLGLVDTFTVIFSFRRNTVFSFMQSIHTPCYYAFYSIFDSIIWVWCGHSDILLFD